MIWCHFWQVWEHDPKSREFKCWKIISKISGGKFCAQIGFKLLSAIFNRWHWTNPRKNQNLQGALRPYVFSLEPFSISQSDQNRPNWAQNYQIGPKTTKLDPKLPNQTIIDHFWTLKYAMIEQHHHILSFLVPLSVFLSRWIKIFQVLENCF